MKIDRTSCTYSITYGYHFVTGQACFSPNPRPYVQSKYYIIFGCEPLKFSAPDVKVFKKIKVNPILNGGGVMLGAVHPPPCCGFLPSLKKSKDNPYLKILDFS